tara:strand:- start:23 stop:484 length:462 start_codon:yes stop_codon:yes gene_type:complete
MHLFVVSLVVVRVVNIEITKLVRGFRWGNYVQVVTKLLLLQVFLCQIFQVTLGERGFGRDQKLGFVTGDGDLVAQVSSFTVNFDPIGQKFLEGSHVQNIILYWGVTVKGELFDLFLCRGFAGHCYILFVDTIKRLLSTTEGLLEMFGFFKNSF